ncbi:MAG: hypothetical protein RIQ53_14 [Pseudomonadota bacterium]|jgi:uncharacterized membrane protein YjgN (DUF898 family)
MSVPSVALATRLTVAFEGRPLDYALLWWRGALLTLLSLGLYLPWAWQSCRRWRLAHTRIGGHALDCTLAPRQLLPLVVALQLQGLLTWQSWALWGGPGLLGGLLLLLLSLPGLQWRFWRLSWGHLCWRGRPLSFDGPLRRAWWMLGPLPWLGAVSLTLPWLTSQVALHAPAQLPPLLSALLLGALPVALLLWPWLLWRRQRWLACHLSYAGERLHCGLEAAEVYALCLDLARGPFLLLSALLLGAALLWPWAGALPPLLAGGLDGLGLAGADWVARGLRIGGPTLVLTAALLLLPLGWPLAAGLQDLTLSKVRTDRLQMHSQTRTPRLARMAWQELAAVACSAGLWWPLAQLRWWRRRIAGVSVLVQGDPARWHLPQALPAPGPRPRGRARGVRPVAEAAA